MADPFELRLFFSNRLRALNPCEDNSEDVVSFALKHRDLDEDLWSCVIEQVERDENNINVRANICYALEDLVELARREKHLAYVRMVERDFQRVVDAVVPLDGLGVVNVNCVMYVLHVLHYELGVFAKDAEGKGMHDAAMGQIWETRTFEELEAYLEKRAVEARPDLVEEETDEEEEVDMSWVDAPVDTAVASTMEVDQRPTTNTVATDIQPKQDKDLVMTNAHDLPSPPGTRSPSSDGNTPQRTPVPPSPLSPSPSPDAQSTQQAQESVKSPTSTQVNGVQSHSIIPSAAPKVFSPVRQSTTNADATSMPSSTTAAAGAAQTRTSPSAYTPVQKEDANIFAQAYFELATERMEQDRERQRRKEDSSGFVAVAGTVDEEVAQILAASGGGAAGSASGKGDVWLEELVAERVVWAEMGE